ncbi:hypothetical protein [Serratia sp. M24T3]|uniref:hypothetical protein n=1 Tax=Serratia sp. M24T3 TaxID=932213 RepID=UPI00025B8F53|nr:hypothetical protein [Serratia sp. M24T3]EIC84009.1 hypothetical protein SPM24T3_13870 [Serratia sp. M24T3]
MNQQNNDGWWTHFWATLTTIASAAGLSTEQWIYVLCALFGALLSFSTFLNNRNALKVKQTLDEKRTDAMVSFLAGHKGDSEVNPANVAEKVESAMDQVE